MKKSMDEIRALVDPEGWLRALRTAKEALESNLAIMFVDYDMAKASPEILAKTRAEVIARHESQIRDVEWRLGEIQRRIDAATEGATGRAARRRKSRE